MEEKTSKKGATAGGTPIESATPLAHEEIEAQCIAEQHNTDTPPEKVQPKKKTQEHKPLEPHQKLNPKRGLNSRPS